MELVGRYQPGKGSVSSTRGDEPGLWLGPLTIETSPSPSPMRLKRANSGALYAPGSLGPGPGPRLAISLGSDNTLEIEPDHLGQADLYYSEDARGLAFSTRPGLIGHEKKLGPDALLGYLIFGHIPSPRTPFEGLSILPGGERLTAGLGGVSLSRHAAWARAAAGPGFNLVDAVAREVCRALDAFPGPVGLLLSAGVDSAGLLSILREATDRRIYTYTVSADPGAAEPRAAREISSYFGTVHRHLEATGGLFARVPGVVASLDAPFGNPSSLLVDLAMERAAAEVDLVFSGLGADELFSGHTKHRILWGMASLPAPLGWASGIAAVLLGLLPAHALSPRAFRLARFVLAARRLGPGAGYLWLYSTAHPLWAKGWGLDAPVGFCPGAKDRCEDADIRLWLMDGPGRFTSRLAAKRGLVAAFPLAAPPILRYALGLSLKEKVNLRATKLPVRRAFSKRVPRSLLGRPGTGFVLPRALWDRAGDLFKQTLTNPSETLLAAVGRDALNALLAAYRKGDSGVFPFLYSLAALEVWLEDEAG